MMNLAIVIPTYQRITKLERCLRSLCNQTYKNFSVHIYCDNNDTSTFNWIDETYIGNSDISIYSTLNSKQEFVVGIWNKFLKATYPYKYYPSKSDYDAVLFLVDDVELDKDCLANAVAELIKNYPDTDGVIGIHQVCPGHPNYTYCPVGQCLVGSKFIMRYQNVSYKLCCPDYKHFQMGEFYKYVQYTNKFTLCKDAILSHYHPSFIESEVDNTHNLLRTDIRKNDQETAKKRNELGLIWGKTWELINGGV